MTNLSLQPKVIREIEKVTEVGSYLWQREWAERNGGNISIDITDIFGELPASLEPYAFVTLTGFPQASAGKIYYVKGKGERIRELNKPDEAGCILRINDQVTGYHILWGGRQQADYQPTSEFISHVKILLSQHHTDHRCVVHTHPHELIALSHHPILGQDKLAYNLACSSMLPEVRVFVPRGIDLVPYTLSGSEQLADLTVSSLQEFDVSVWEKHGAVATGSDALEAFDFIDVANKGAKIYLSCLAAGFTPDGLNQTQLLELEQVFEL